MYGKFKYEKLLLPCYVYYLVFSEYIIRLIGKNMNILFFNPEACPCYLYRYFVYTFSDYEI